MNPIPSDWGWSAIGDQAFVTKLAGFEYTLHFDYTKSGPIIAIRAMNIQKGTLDLAEVHTIPRETSEALPRSKLEKGDLVISYVGTLGRVAVIPEDNKFHLAPNVAKLSVNLKAVSPEYLCQFLNGATGQKLIHDAAASTTQAALSMRSLRCIQFLHPPLQEQEAIAEALSDADALIASLEQLLVKKRDIKLGAMQELLSGRKRLAGFEKACGWKRTEVGEIPKDWDVEKLRAICLMKSGEGITSTELDQFSQYPCYGGNGLRGFTKRPTHDGHHALIGRQGALCGNVLGVKGKFFASEHAIVVTASSQTDIVWLTYVLGRMRLNRYSESSAQPGLSVSKLLNLLIAHPPNKAEQVAVANVLTDVDAEIVALEAKLAKANLLKQGMMQELLTGRIRLI
jgi:type I restriction enzyme, S subunit